MTWYFLLGLFVLVAASFAEDPLEGKVQYAFHPGGGEKTIGVPPGNRLALELTALSLAPNERFSILDGPCDDEASPELTSLTWSKENLYTENVGSTVFSSGNVACVRYRAGPLPGAVLINYRAFPKCKGKMKLQIGDIVNPTYPGKRTYTDNESCEWIAEVEYGQRIHVTVKEFNMSLIHNFVMLYGISGYDRQHPMLTLTKSMPKEYETDWWDLTVEYVAGRKAKSEDRGFWIHYEAIGCPKKLLPKPKDGLWSSYRDYLAFGHVMYMQCRYGYKFASGVGSRHYSLKCENNRTWTKSWDGDLEDCVEV